MKKILNNRQKEKRQLLQKEWPRSFTADRIDPLEIA